jgi:site-specific recombinase XerC
VTALRWFSKKPAGLSNSRSPSRLGRRSAIGLAMAGQPAASSCSRAASVISRISRRDSTLESSITGSSAPSSAYGTHSMRRTKAAQIYKKTGNLRAVQLLLGHTKLESTVRYLGIEVDDALSISEQVEL